MTTINIMHNQWMNRPDDERFLSLTDLLEAVKKHREFSRSAVVSTHGIKAVPVSASELMLEGPNGGQFAPTNWAFGQLANLSGAQASYLRKLPAPLAADCINYGLKFIRKVDDVGVLVSKIDGNPEFRAATGPNYGRIWNAEIAQRLVDAFGDGRTGQWRVPGAFGSLAGPDLSKKETTLYASDRDMIVFLSDESNKLELPNRRDGETGTLTRGIIIGNSEVGAGSLWMMGFLYDHMCCNHYIWGAQNVEQFRIRHTASAPDKWAETMVPALEALGNSLDDSLLQTIERARAAKLGDDLDKFLAERFGPRSVETLKARHLDEEHRPIETVWDVIVASTALNRDAAHIESRIAKDIETGKLFNLF